MSMNENAIADNKPKRNTGLIVAVIILSILLLATVTVSIIQLVKSTKLDDAIKKRDDEIESLEEEVEKLKGDSKKCKSTNSGGAPIEYDATEVIEATDDNGEIGDHVRGKKNSKVVVVEYADLSCPGCANMMPRMSKLYEDYGDKVAFVFRHFPLKDHQNSRSASAAIESAGYQDYYWEMLEALYASRSDWLYATGQERTDIYVKVFKEVAPDGDVDKFRNDMNDERIEKKISFDYNIGKDKSGVNATPAIYVNGKQIDMTDNKKTFDDIEDEIRSMIKKELDK